MLMYCLYKNEYRIFKPVETTIRKVLRQKKKNRRDEQINVKKYIYVYIYTYMHGSTTRKFPV
jgi:hypothetical protein